MRPVKLFHLSFQEAVLPALGGAGANRFTGGRLIPSDTMTCSHFSCAMPSRDCILRQRARYEGHGTWKSVAGRVPVRLEYCEQGKGIKLQLSGQKIQPSRPVNLRAQWAAKRKAAEAKSILPPALVAD